MTRTQRVIKAFIDYDRFLAEMIVKTNDRRKEEQLVRLRRDVSILVKELRRYGCRREV